MKNFKESIVTYFKNFKAALFKPEMLVLPGQLAFFFILSIVPTITLIGIGAGLLNLSTDVIYNFIRTAFNEGIASVLVANPSHALGFKYIFTMIVGYYFASNGAASIIVTSNTIYGIENNSFIKRRIKAMLMTIIIILLFIFMIIVPVLGSKITEMIAFVNMKQSVTDKILMVFNFLKGPITWFIMFVFIKMIYTMAPDKKIESRYVNKGAIFTTIGWVLATNIYSYYIGHYAKYDVFYGGLANIIVLMLWFLILAYILTIGIAVNHKVEEEELEKTSKINVIKE
ncbi:MAG: YihY/virulence factor BrkB family protein [Bacilli bacterium]|nr:YihY/virulence factor BrkB family protein [Bacilli bacterium]